MTINKRVLGLTFIAATIFTLNSYAAYHKQQNNNKHEEKVTLHEVIKGASTPNIGYVMLKDTKNGLLITPHLTHVAKGFHGFHVHVKPSCADHGLAAGGHFDPAHTGKHLGPYANGHLGDLPVLYANAKGEITGPVIAPRVTLQQIRGHALMLHAGGDNYSDHPKKLGGGGTRFACGVVK